jgi:hypothetical protein
VPAPLFLYSTITNLAYALGQRYYGQKHYVWCAPVRGVDRFSFPNPPSSDPIAIYWELHEAITKGDEHNARISDNRRGLIRGASVRESQGIIDTKTRQLIEAVVGRAQLRDFKPLLLVIPYPLVEAMAKPADIPARARATSDEYIIEELPRDCFDVLELKGDT